jgi:hypothetical protein
MFDTLQCESYMKKRCWQKRREQRERKRFWNSEVGSTNPVA